jgi:uncharacterized protein YjbI with pentapeptide repeats
VLGGVCNPLIGQAGPAREESGSHYRREAMGERLRRAAGTVRQVPVRARRWARRVRRAAGRVRRVSVWAGWLIAVAVMSAFVVWLVLFAPAHFVPAPNEADLRTIDAARRLELQNDVRTTLLQGLGGLAVLVGAFFTYRQLGIAREGQVTERFTRAIDQLGNDNMDVRLGGIYALERMANDSPQDRATIGRILNTFVRGHAPWPPTRPSQPPEGTPIEDIPLLAIRAADVQLALTMICRREAAIHPGRTLELRETDLRNADLQNTDLRGANLWGARLNGTNFFGAQLQGALLWTAELKHVHLIGAKVQQAILSNAQLQDAQLYGTHLQEAHLEGAQLQRADLQKALLQDAYLIQAQLQGADLRGAQLQGADLRGAQVQGANLMGARLEGAQCSPETAWPDEFDWRAAGVKLLER